MRRHRQDPEVLLGAVHAGRAMAPMVGAQQGYAQPGAPKAGRVMRPPALRLSLDELVVDNFAGAGGASLGVERAIGRAIDIAINHDPTALAVHAANHPRTRHLCESVWDVDPVEACGGRPVGLAWFSPTCTHFSRAKGGPLRDAKIRALAWIVTRWMKAVRPRVVCLENVSEFESWGPLTDAGVPCPKRAGFTFRRWIAKMRSYGYAVEWRSLVAADYGSPTTRKRLFLVARCDGEPIVWPSATHGSARAPYRTAAECIDWTLPVPSIFARKRPLADATLRRIARGVQRFVLDAAEPFTAPTLRGLASPSLIQTGYGERDGQAPRILDVHAPLGTVVAGGQKHALVAAFLAKHFGGHESPGGSLVLPMSTVTARDHHAVVTASTSGERQEDVRALMLKYHGGERDHARGQQLGLPMRTVDTSNRFATVTAHGERYEIADIGMRLLEPHELAAAQGFPADYSLDAARTKTAKIRLVGNSVCPQVAEAIVAANVGARERRGAA